jgi:hypothetical protein
MAEFTPQDELDYMNSISGAWEAADLFLNTYDGYRTLGMPPSTGRILSANVRLNRLSTPNIQLTRNNEELTTWLNSLRHNTRVLDAVVALPGFDDKLEHASLVVFVQRLTRTRQPQRTGDNNDKLHAMMRDHPITDATAHFMGITRRAQQRHASGNFGSKMEIWPALDSLAEIAMRLGK